MYVGRHPGCIRKHSKRCESNRAGTQKIQFVATGEAEVSSDCDRSSLSLPNNALRAQNNVTDSCSTVRVGKGSLEARCRRTGGNFRRIKLMVTRICVVDNCSGRSQA